MGKPLADDDLPPSRRSDYRHDGTCRHLTRKFKYYPECPVRGDKVVYLCIECGKQKVLTI